MTQVIDADLREHEWLDCGLVPKFSELPFSQSHERNKEISRTFLMK